MRRLAWAFLVLAAACAGPERAPAAQSASSEVPAPSGSAPAPKSVAAKTPADLEHERLYFPADGEQFEKKRPPAEGDWLARFHEAGQSFLRYQSLDPVRPTPDRNKIVLQPLGSFRPRELALLGDLREQLSTFFVLSVEVRKPMPLPAKGRRLRDDDGKHWTQHSTRVLLDEVLAPRVPKDAVIYVGVTLADLYPAPGWNYVFGEASLEDRVGVYSLVRFFPEFWGEQDSPKAREKGLARSFAVLAHETGHAFGMAHCTDYECVMNGSNSLDELDRQFGELCPICLRKLAWNIGFDPMRRYEKLRDFYRREGVETLASWMDRRLASLETPR